MTELDKIRTRDAKSLTWPEGSAAAARDTRPQRDRRYLLAALAERDAQIERLRALRASRDQAGVDAAIDDVRAAARGTQNLLVPMREALKRRATLGEVSDALREVFGEYRPNR